MLLLMVLLNHDVLLLMCATVGAGGTRTSINCGGLAVDGVGLIQR
jgi:hypothetical protein